MSQTAPPNRDTKTGDPKPDTDVTPETSRNAKQAKPSARETSSRDWKETVAAVTSTVTDAAIEAVTVVGDAARSLTARARGGKQSESDHESDGRSGPDGATKTTSDDTAGTDGGPQLLGGVRKKLRIGSPDDGTGAVGDGAAARTRAPRGRGSKPSGEPVVRGNRGNGAAAPQRNGTATQLRGRAPAPEFWAFRPGTDVREPAWLPSLRQRSDQQRSWLMRATTFIVATMAGFAALIVIAVALLPRAFALAAESARAELILPEDTEFDALASRTRVLYSDGSLMAILHGEQDRNPVSIEKMPDHAWQAVVAEEDRKFFEHDGYDPVGIGRALVANFQAGGVEQGGSTISQQVARMNFEEVGADQSIERKIKEVVYAMAIERRFEKEEILNRYVNQVYFGAGAYGLQAASEEFFDRNVVDITVDQAALLAGLISSPSAHSPRDYPDQAKQQRDLVLQSMAKAGYITQAEATDYMQKPLKIAPEDGSTIKQPSIVEAIMREFKSNPLFGATEQEREDNLFNGGLRITTTINKRLQKLAERTVEAHYPSNRPTAVIASVNPRTGAILAAASSKKYNKDNFSLGLQGRRQPGSAFKPFVMAEALRQGFSPETTLDAKSPLVIPMPGEDWTVQNYGGASYGHMDMRTATTKSVNTYYAQLMVLVGADKAAKLTDKMGIDGSAAYDSMANPAMVLGGVARGLTPVEMASAYGTFARNGVHVEAHLLAEVKRGKKDVLPREPQKTQVLDPRVNAVALDILRGPVSPGGTAPMSLPNFPIVGKTGTTQLATDAWFVGTTPVMSTAVWVGYPEGQIRMAGYTGGGMAAPVWLSYMSAALEGREPRDFPEVEDAEFVGKMIKVPDVTGLSEQQALSKLAKVKLVGRVQRQASPSPVGTVIWASPDDEAQMGTTVYLGVSTGEPPPPPEDDESDEDESGDQKPDDSGGQEGESGNGNEGNEGGGNGDGGD